MPTEHPWPARAMVWVAQRLGRIDPIAAGDRYYDRGTGMYLRVESVGPSDLVTVSVAQTKTQTQGGRSRTIDGSLLRAGLATNTIARVEELDR